MLRLDKCLADAGVGTRSEVKKLIRSGRVQVNDVPQKSPEEKVDPERDKVTVDGTPIRTAGPVVLMLHKPAGVVSATQDRREKTVLDLVREPYAKDLFPVGRLDKDTEGLLLLTSDGALAHDLLSPRRHVEKTYLALVTGQPEEALIDRFREGLDIGEKRPTAPAGLRFLPEEETDPFTCWCEVVLTEGKFHQVKRMFAAVGRKVLYLKRTAMGALQLDEALEPGAYRPLTEEELASLRSVRGQDDTRCGYRPGPEA